MAGLCTTSHVSQHGGFTDDAAVPRGARPRNTQHHPVTQRAAIPGRRRSILAETPLRAV